MITVCVHRVAHVLALIGIMTMLCSAARAQAPVTPPASMPSPQEEQARPPDAGPPSEAGDVHERGVIRDHRTQTGTITPSQPTPTPLHPGGTPQLIIPATPLTPAGSALGLKYVGPTDDITKVANALAWYHKSLTTLVTVKPGLALTQPVMISIAYLSPAGPGPGSPERLTQGYAISTGNRFLRLDPEGNGRPRRIHLDINLSEPNPTGGVYSFNVPVDMDLDPLYDVTIGPLSFTLFTRCDLVGDSEIAFEWFSPEGQRRRYDFSASAGNHNTLNLFSWHKAEVGTSANMHIPALHFCNPDFISFCTNFSPTTTNLVPGVSRQVVTSLEEGGNQCSASAQYNMTYTLRWYADLDSPTVRDHR